MAALPPSPREGLGRGAGEDGPGCTPEPVTARLGAARLSRFWETHKTQTGQMDARDTEVPQCPPDGLWGHGQREWRGRKSEQKTSPQHSRARSCLSWREPSDDPGTRPGDAVLRHGCEIAVRRA